MIFLLAFLTLYYFPAVLVLALWVVAWPVQILIRYGRGVRIRTG